MDTRVRGGGGMNKKLNKVKEFFIWIIMVIFVG